MNWFEEHILLILAAVGVAVLLLMVWVFRRESKGSSNHASPAPITPDMVREKLEKINLDLDVPPSDEPQENPQNKT